MHGIYDVLGTLCMAHANCLVHYAWHIGCAWYTVCGAYEVPGTQFGLTQALRVRYMLPIIQKTKTRGPGKLKELAHNLPTILTVQLLGLGSLGWQRGGKWVGG